MHVTKFTAFAAAALFSVSLAACDNASGDTGGSAESSPAPMMSSAAPSMAPSQDSSMATFGSGCSAVPKDASNPGSFQAMAQVPVATAASGNPLLSTLVSAVKKAGLVDSLNSAPDLTVFAPTNDAFKKIPSGTLNKAMADQKTLTSILTYHVVPGKLTPDQLAGTHKTLQGGTVTVSGSGVDYQVDGKASVVCGNVRTANATVYIIDSVLMPKG